MTKEDFEQLQRLREPFSQLATVGLLSPIRGGERKVFPKATELPRWRWDLNKPGTRHFDLLVASNVFMYSSDPSLWFRHVLASCKYFLMIDLLRRRRSEGSEFGSDGDRARYGMGEVRPRVEPYFDLATLGDRLLGHRLFPGGANTFDQEPLHVVALFRGDRAGPVLRIDDYPTGIRPILSDLSPLHDLLRRVEALGVPYHLAIVPALLTEEMWGFLGGMRNMIPVVHGYDHAHPKYAALLMEKGDPFNAHTVGIFNEFKGQPYDQILTRLREGRRLLEERLGKPVTAYVPPCNIGDRRTGRALVEAGYGSYLSEKRIPGCGLPWVRSDYYGRSDQYPFERSPEVVTLHLTWERDLIRQGGRGSFDRLLDHLLARASAERERGARLGAIVSAADHPGV